MKSAHDWNKVFLSRGIVSPTPSDLLDMFREVQADAIEACVKVVDPTRHPIPFEPNTRDYKIAQLIRETWKEFAVLIESLNPLKTSKA